MNEIGYFFVGLIILLTNQSIKQWKSLALSLRLIAAVWQFVSLV